MSNGASLSGCHPPTRSRQHVPDILSFDANRIRNRSPCQSCFGFTFFRTQVISRFVVIGRKVGICNVSRGSGLDFAPVDSQPLEHNSSNLLLGLWARGPRVWATGGTRRRCARNWHDPDLARCGPGVVHITCMARARSFVRCDTGRGAAETSGAKLAYDTA